MAIGVALAQKDETSMLRQNLIPTVKAAESLRLQFPEEKSSSGQDISDVARPPVSTKAKRYDKQLTTQQGAVLEGT